MSTGDLDNKSVSSKISETTFKALIWTSAAVAFPFVPARLFVRWKVFHKFFIDDFFLVLAYLLLLAYAIYWQIRSRYVYLVSDIVSGLAPPNAHFMEYFAPFINSELICFFLHAFCLWFIKLAFLLFFRRLGQKVKHQKVIWWGVFVYNMAAFAVWMGTAPWSCIAVDPQVALTTCQNEGANYLQNRLKIQVAMDISSDIAIIILPINILWTVQIHLRKKIALGGTFSLSVFIMIASFVRTVVYTSAANLDESWYYTWSAIEMAIAIIVACLVSFRALFTSNAKSQRLHRHQNNYQISSERQAFQNIGFQTTNHSSITISAAKVIHEPKMVNEPPCPFDQFIKNLSVDEQSDLGDLESRVAEQGYSSSTISSRRGIFAADDDHIHVHTEFSVYPETSNQGSK